MEGWSLIGVRKIYEICVCCKKLNQPSVNAVKYSWGTRVTVSIIASDAWHFGHAIYQILIETYCAYRVHITSEYWLRLIQTQPPPPPPWLYLVSILNWNCGRTWNAIISSSDLWIQGVLGYKGLDFESKVSGQGISWRWTMPFMGSLDTKINFL